ncbi:MAG: o-succinylbenzoate synthase [Actinomycetaceae bacterium]|nr:o-succinylbenzoate synthase [Actinomycetaceae bacterium]MDY6082797.1 o-succinylbenzoate synthase [Actinomycetaceae bacterium]
MESASVRLLALPLVAPLVTAWGSMDIRRIGLLQLTLRGGAVGYAEISSFDHPWYTEETLFGAMRVILDDLVPLLAGHDDSDPVAALQRLASVKRNFAAKAAVEEALWDAWASERGISIAQAVAESCADLREQPTRDLAGSATERPAEADGSGQWVPVGISIGIQSSVSRTLDAVGQAVAEGYQRVKLKIRPGWDVQPVAACRKQFPDLALFVDANGAYDPDRVDDMAALRALDAWNVSLIEEPFPAHDLVAHARLRSQIATPVCLDEAVCTPQDMHTAVELGAIDVVNVKPARCGGIVAALSVAEAARHAGVRSWLGGMYESSLGRALILQLAYLYPFDFPGDLSDPRHYLKMDIVTSPLEYRHGFAKVPLTQGYGVTIDTSAVRAVEVPGTAQMRCLS